MMHLDLFSGYGGFSMAMERHGIRTVAFAEIDRWSCRILAKRWPDVPNLSDVRTIDGREVRRRFGPIDVVRFGSPCQDLSIAGARQGLGSKHDRR